VCRNNHPNKMNASARRIDGSGFKHHPPTAICFHIGHGDLLYILGHFLAGSFSGIEGSRISGTTSGFGSSVARTSVVRTMYKGLPSCSHMSSLLIWMNEMSRVFFSIDF